LGAHIDHGNNTNGYWSHLESQKHINVLELLGAKFALLSLLLDSRDVHIRVMSDNTTTVSYINAMGGCKSLECNRVAQDIWGWVITRNNWVSAAHIPGASNVEADALSRKLTWIWNGCCRHPFFQKIGFWFGEPSIDLFASRNNAQLPLYVSWEPDPQAKYVDAFTVDWSGISFYALPPFCLIYL